MQIESQPVCAIVGAGPGNGHALGRRFAAQGYRVALLARNGERLSQLSATIPGSRTYECDVGDAASISAAFAKIEAEMGHVGVLIYNAGKGVWGDALSVTPEEFESAWRTNALGGFLCARHVLPAMVAAERGAIVFVGATASRRGGAQTVAFAAAKGAQRLMAQSLARAYGPKGVHVSLMIIDAVVGAPLMRTKFAERPDEFFCAPDDIADTAFMLTQQHRCAWTFELDLRPHAEKW